MSTQNNGGQPRPQLYSSQSVSSFDKLESMLNQVPYTSRPRVKQDILSLLPGYSAMASPWSLFPKVATHG